MDLDFLKTILVVAIPTIPSILNTVISQKTKKKVESIDDVKKELKADINNASVNYDQKMKDHILEADKTFLTDFISDIKMGIQKTEIQYQRASEIYKRYIENGGNSYVKENWEKYIIPLL